MVYRKLPSIIDEEALKKLVKAELARPLKCQGMFRFFKLRNIMMFQFQFYLFLRPGECRNARICELDLESKQFFISGDNNKLKQDAVVTVPDILIEPIKAYLALRNVYFPQSEWLFPSYFNRPIIRGTYSRILQNVAKGLILGRVVPYSFRHGSLTQAYLNRGRIEEVKALARHRDIHTTLKYIHISDEKIREKVINKVFVNNQKEVTA